MKKIAAFILALIILAYGAIAFAQLAGTSSTSTAAAAPALSDNLFELIPLMAQAFKSHAYTLGAAIALAVLVAVLRFVNLLNWLPDKYDRWVAMAIAMLTSVSLGLQTEQDWITIVVTAISVGAAAVGGWEMALKPVRDAVAGRNRM